MESTSARVERRLEQEALRSAKSLGKQSAAACELVLVRHGETNWNLERRLQGQTIPGPALNPRGVLQAQALAQRLAQERFSRIYSSDLIRCVQTAGIIIDRQKNPLSLVTNSALRERCLGLIQGLTMAEARTSHPRAIAGLVRSNDAALEAGIEGHDAMAVRISDALEKIAAEHAGERVLVVTHGGVIAASARIALSGNSPYKKEAANCSINALRIDATKTPPLWAMVEWGDDAHVPNNKSGSFGGSHLGG
jgi:probable phosphoglycerate mutase